MVVIVPSPMFTQVFVANPNKPRDVKIILAKNRVKLLELLRNLSPAKGYIIFTSVDFFESHTCYLDCSKFSIHAVTYLLKKENKIHISWFLHHFQVQKMSNLRRKRS